MWSLEYHFPEKAPQETLETPLFVVSGNFGVSRPVDTAVFAARFIAWWALRDELYRRKQKLLFCFFSFCLVCFFTLSQFFLRLWQALFFCQKVNSVSGQDTNSNLFSLFGCEVCRFREDLQLVSWRQLGTKKRLGPSRKTATLPSQQVQSSSEAAVWGLALS